jgi:DNA polymerase sigma
MYFVNVSSIEANARFQAENYAVRNGVVDAIQPYLPSIQDPADESNDLGRKCSGWKHIQATFKEIYRRLDHRMRALQRSKVNPKDVSVLLQAVGSAYPTYSSRREMQQEYGRRLLRLSIEPSTGQSGDGGANRADID